MKLQQQVVDLLLQERLSRPHLKKVTTEVNQLGLKPEIYTYYTLCYIVNGRFRFQQQAVKLFIQESLSQPTGPETRNIHILYIVLYCKR